MSKQKTEKIAETYHGLPGFALNIIKFNFPETSPEHQVASGILDKRYANKATFSNYSIVSAALIESRGEKAC